MIKEEKQGLNPSVEVVIKLFASHKDIIGKDKITLKMTEKITTVRDLKRMILEVFPSFPTKIQLVIAVNHKIAADDITINHLDEVAILPPVSGG
jgi:molybdopterin converting factor subunit 1